MCRTKIGTFLPNWMRERKILTLCARTTFSSTINSKTYVFFCIITSLYLLESRHPVEILTEKTPESRSRHHGPECFLEQLLRSLKNSTRRAWYIFYMILHCLKYRQSTSRQAKAIVFCAERLMCISAAAKWTAICSAPKRKACDDEWKLLLLHYSTAALGIHSPILFRNTLQTITT